MYTYNAVDQKIVDERVAQYRDQTRRYLAGELAEDEFRALRLMNGLYIQTHAPMLRVAIPYGLLSSKQLRMFAHIARKYDKGYGHFTTRQNIQYNWPKLEDVPDILADLASVQMHAIQTSGNCIRNTTSDELAGVAVDEIEDPRPYCELIRQWSTFHPEFAYLPRKFKIAVTGADKFTGTDRAAIQVHDIGLQMVKHTAKDEIGFEVFVGGGLGRTPVIGKVVRDYLPKQDLLSYLEAILRVYNQYGRRDNKYKARIKILVNALGVDKFRELVEAEWQEIKDSSLQVSTATIHDMQQHFTRPDYNPQANAFDQLDTQANSNTLFKAWLKYNTKAHKQAGYKAVIISLKAPGVPPGDMTHEQMDAVAELADQYSFDELRVMHNQNLVLADVEHKDLFTVWQKLEALNLAWANIGSINDMICCPGLDFCSLANASSISIAKQINDKFDNIDYLHDIGEIKLKMSGCMNACGHHHVGHIGILGVDKKGEEWYQIQVGGDAENNAALGKVLGPSVAKDQVANTLEKLLDVYVNQRETNERFIDTYRRIGIKPFKERVYA